MQYTGQKLVDSNFVGRQAKGLGLKLQKLVGSLCLGLFCLLSLPSSSFGTVIYIKGEPNALTGRIIREDETHLTIRLFEPLDGENERTVLKSEIAALLRAIEPEKLTALDPAQPQAYFELAEQLSVKEMDPEAIELAIRLFLIAADRGDEELRRSAFLGLVQIARTSEEERLFRALAFQLDPLHLSDWLKEPERQVLKENELDTEQKQEIQRLLRLVRSGRGSHARNLLRQDPIREALESIESEIPYRDFINASQQDVLPKSFLEKSLGIEISILRQSSGGDWNGSNSTGSKEDWSTTLSFSAAPVQTVSLSRVSEFDPRKCLFRDGKWVTP